MSLNFSFLWGWWTSLGDDKYHIFSFFSFFSLFLKKNHLRVYHGLPKIEMKEKETKRTKKIADFDNIP